MDIVDWENEGSYDSIISPQLNSWYKIHFTHFQ